MTLIEQWPDHVEAMRASGIEVRLPTETQVTPVRALHLCEVATLREPFDIVFVLGQGLRHPVGVRADQARHSPRTGWWSGCRTA